MKKEKNTKSKKPIYKKPIFIILGVFIIFTFIGAILNTDTTINNNQPVSNLNDDNNETSTTQEEQNISDYLNLKTAEEVKKAYDENLEKIMNKEKIESAKQATFEDLLKRAEKAQEIALTTEGATNKIDTVTNLVALDFLVSDIKDDVLDEILQYLISEYKNNTLLNNETLEKNLYLARVLDKSLNQNENKIKEASISFDIFQLLKDTIRINDENFKEELKEDVKISIEENKIQIEKAINNF